MNRKPDPMNDVISILRSFLPVVFMVFWTVTAVKAGAPVIFAVMGTGFLLLTVLTRIQNIRKIRQRRRDEDLYGSSAYPYDDGAETSAGEYYQSSDKPEFSGRLGNIYQYTDTEGNIYCPYCGVKIAHDFEYCPHCGKKLPF